MSNYLIQVGPTLGTSDPKQPRVYSVIDTDTYTHLASVIVNTDRTLTLYVENVQPIDGIMYFLTSLAKQFKGQPITASDENAVTLVTALSDTVESQDATVVAAWTGLNFEVTATNHSNTQAPDTTIRFVGMGIAGLKRLVSASSIKMTITAK